MSQKNNELELYIAEKIKPIDPWARPTKASGASTEIGDVLNDSFYAECKLRNTKNITIDRKVWIDFLSKLANPQKFPIYALQNKFKDRFVVMDAEDFFRLAYKAFGVDTKHE